MRFLKFIKEKQGVRRGAYGFSKPASYVSVR